MLKQYEQEDLDNLHEIRGVWRKKLNTLRLQEAKTADANNLHSITTEIENANKKIKGLEAEIKELEDKQIQTVTTPILSIVPLSPVIPLTYSSEILQADEILLQESKKIDLDSTKEEIAKVHSLRIKMSESDAQKEFDRKILLITSKRDLLYPSVLFDTIYTSEVLDAATASEIQKIREDYAAYKPHDRSVLISALSLSLFNFKFDAKKANILLDFVTDFEPNVWERALTGLILAILYQKNRSWERATIVVNRLKTLQHNTEIQDGIRIIDFILKNELYKANIANPKLFTLDLFKNPMNCFVPFYLNNEVLNNAIDNADNDFELEEFLKDLNELPFIDSYKYALCIALSENRLKKERLKKEDAIAISQSLSLSDIFSPFQNLISEFFFFFSHYPEKLVEDVFSKQLQLTKTSLRTFILNKVTQLLLEGNRLYEEEKYREASVQYQSLLKIEKSHDEALWQLAACHLKNNENVKALNIYLTLEQDSEKGGSRDLLFKIAVTYNQMKDYTASNEYCEKVMAKVENPSFNHLDLMASNYTGLNDFPNAQIYCAKAEEKITEGDEYLKLAEIYLNIEKFIDALRLAKMASKTKGNKASYWLLLGRIYCELCDWDLSISALKKSMEIEKKDNPHTFMSLGRAYMLSNTDLNEAKKFLNKALKINSDCKDIVHGNLGHVYLIEGDNTKAMENYNQCIYLIEDEADFVRRMKIDLPFMLKLGIAESEYEAVIDKVLAHERLRKKAK